jgi:hypothetical protein
MPKHGLFQSLAKLNECAQLVIKRDELCIAADREQQYFKGVWHDLPKFGIDMLIIEKEGVVETVDDGLDFSRPKCWGQL